MAPLGVVDRNHIVLMACQRPEMDGYEARRLIRNGTPKSQLKIIAMTANAMQGEPEMARSGNERLTSR